MLKLVIVQMSTVIIVYVIVFSINIFNDLSMNFLEHVF